MLKLQGKRSFRRPRRERTILKGMIKKYCMRERLDLTTSGYDPKCSFPNTERNIQVP
jgi:hypothetical protein